MELCFNNFVLPTDQRLLSVRIPLVPHVTPLFSECEVLFMNGCRLTKLLTAQAGSVGWTTSILGSYSSRNHGVHDLSWFTQLGPSVVKSSDRSINISNNRNCIITLYFSIFVDDQYIVNVTIDPYICLKLVEQTCV